MKRNLILKQIFLTFLLCLFCRCERKPIQFDKTLEISGGWNYENYFMVAEECADKLLKFGVDSYGKKDTPALLSLLELNHLKPINPAISEINPYQANLYYDFPMLEAFYKLSEISHNTKYKIAADRYLKFYLNNSVNPETGLIGYGKKNFYNTLTDSAAGTQHELDSYLPLLDQMWQLEPEKMRTYTDAIYKYHFQNPKTFAFHRAVDFKLGKIVPDSIRSDIVNATLFVNIFWYAFLRTHEPQYLTWTRNTILQFWKEKSPITNLVRDVLQDSTNFQTRQLPLAAWYLLQSTEILKNDFLQSAGLTFLEAFTRNAFNFEHQSFFESINTQDGQPVGKKYQDLWEGDGMAIISGRACVLAYKISIDKIFLDHALKYASCIRNTRPSSKTPPRNLGLAIQFYLEMYQSNQSSLFLNEARKLAQFAIEKYFQNGLIKAAPDLNYYSASSGAGELLLAIIELYKTESELEYHWKVPQSAPRGIAQIPVRLQLKNLTSVSVEYVLGTAPAETLQLISEPATFLEFTIPVPDSNFTGNLYFTILDHEKKINSINGMVIITDSLGGNLK